MSARYDEIGRGYTKTRREEPRLRARIERALAGVESLVNVGAGAGAYEPSVRTLVAVEPSMAMHAQRAQGGAHALRASAGFLPLADGSVDGAMSVLSVHHWDDERERGVRELRRVARGPVVLVTIEPEVSCAMWLMADYLPEVAELDRRIFPPTEQLASWLGGVTETHVIPVPRDTRDWTLLSFWAHPERVLDPEARAATSGFARMPAAVVERVVADVQRDLRSGRWEARHGHLRSLTELDAGLRLLVNLPGR